MAILELQQHRAQSVLGWVTVWTRDHRATLFKFFYFLGARKKEVTRWLSKQSKMIKSFKFFSLFSVTITSKIIILSTATGRKLWDNFNIKFQIFIRMIISFHFWLFSCQKINRNWRFLKLCWIDSRF